MIQALVSRVQKWDTEWFLKVFGDVDRKAWKRFFFALSRSADGAWYAAAAVLTAVLAPDRFPVFMAAALAAFVLELSTYFLVKKNIRRPRPFDRIDGIRFLIAPPDKFSFPSGHTAAAFLMAVLLSWVFPYAALPLFGWASLVGFSRVYLGVHYPTDVLAGMTLGFLSAQAGMALASVLFIV